MKQARLSFSGLPVSRCIVVDVFELHNDLESLGATIPRAFFYYQWLGRSQLNRLEINTMPMNPQVVEHHKQYLNFIDITLDFITSRKSCLPLSRIFRGSRVSNDQTPLNCIFPFNI